MLYLSVKYKMLQEESLRILVLNLRLSLFCEFTFTCRGCSSTVHHSIVLQFKKHKIDRERPFQLWAPRGITTWSPKLKRSRSVYLVFLFFMHIPNSCVRFLGGDPFADLPNSAKRDKIPQSKQLRAWERALEQAQKALPLNRQQRKLCYVFKYNDDLQKAPKQSRSPEPAYKRKEKASKKQTKVRARLTRRSCLLDRSKELMPENDSIESLCSPKDLTSDLSADGKSRDSSTPDDISCDVKVEDSAHSPESVGFRRRGRSAGNLSIDGSFVFDAVHVHTKLKEDRKNSSIMSFSKAELADNEFVSVGDVKDFKLAEEKVKMSRMPDSLRAKGLTRKRQREHEKDSIMKAAKKIKVEIVTRKHNVFEIIPKKMKNKQTQTPERKAKRGVATKKKVKRKREISRRTIKTKETSASKKFSRKLKSVSNEKGLIKKALRENRNKRKKEIREASSNCATKRSVRDRKSPRKRSCSGYQAQSNEDIEYINDVSTNKQILLETKFQSIDIMEENVPKRRRGRPRKIQTDSNDDGMAHGMILTDAALSENPAGKSSCRDAHLKGSLNPVDGVKLSESVDQEVKKKTKSSNMGSTGDCLEGRKVRRNKIELPYGDVETPVKKIGDKPAREPSRRSSRHIVASQNDENECVVVCRVSQLPEIDDIVVGNSENNSRMNGINGCVNKRLLLEVLSNIDAEIPIVFEETEDRTTLSRLTAKGSSNTVLQRNSSGHSESNVCTNLKLPLDVTNASHRSPACTVANVEDGNGLELSTSNKDIVENYQCVISDENLSACSMVEPNSKHVNCETYSPKTSLLFAHEDSSCKPYVPVSDLDGFGNNGLISNTQSSQDSCVSRLEMGNANPVASSPDLVTGSEIEPTHVDINAPRAFANSSNLGEFMNDEDGHEYFGNDGADRSNANTVFSRDRLNHVEDTDLYLNDDDIGLPVTKNSQSCALTSSGSDNYPTPYCREMEPSGLLNKVCNVASQFGKSTLDVSGLEDYQPVFSIPSLTLPELTQSASCYQRRLENPCSVISTVSNTSTNSDHISSRYFPIHEAFTEPVAPDTNAGVGPTASHSFGQCETLPGQLGDISRVNCGPLKSVNNPAISGACVDDASCGIIQQGQCQTGLVGNERGSLIASSMNDQVGDEAILQGVSQDIVDNSTDGLQAHHGDNYIGCDLSENKQTLVPVILDGPAETQASLGGHGTGDIDNNNQASLSYHSNRANENNSQATLSCNDNGEVDNGNQTCVSKQDCYSDGKCKLTENDSVLLDGQNSPLNSHSLSTLANHNSPTMHESILHESITMREDCSNDEDLHEPSTTATQEYSYNETQEADSTTLSANSSISERQSPNGEDSGMDSAKVVDDSSQAGNSLKRQRKRKTMSDFHVGLAFDEILSNRGRASDGDKGVSKLSLAKKKRENVKRIDYEEKVRPVKDLEVAEQVEIEEDGQLKEIAKGHCRGRIEDGKRLTGKKRCVSTSEEQGGIGESATLNVDTRRMEETAACTQRVSSDLNGLVIESVPEKKKRGRKPKVKKDKEKCLVGKQVDNSIPQIDGEKVDMVNDVEPSLRNSAIVQGEKTKKKSVDKLRKKTTKSQTSKLKRSNDENKPKRKYVKRKHSQKVTVPGKVEVSQSKKKIDELLQTQIDSAVILTAAECPSVGAIEHETKPKRPYNRRKKPANDALGDSNKNIGRKIDRKYDKKSKVKRKRGRPESLDNSDVANRVGKKAGRKRKSSKIGSESINDESPVTVVLGRPKKYKKKTSVRTEADNRPAKASGARNQSKGEKLSAQIEDVAGKCNSSRIADETTSGLENVIDAKLDGDSNLLRPPLPFFDSKKVKRNDRLETRSNFSDETASISGRETDESGKNKKESICTICEQGDCLLVCNGVCYSSFHPDCLGLSTVPEKFYCDECLTGNHSCFLCKETGNLRKCSFPMCGKYYHDACTQKMRGCRLDNSRLICPLHSCGTCTNDKENSSTSKKRLLRCVRCPTAYHASRCLVAGCMQLTNTLMVCNRHFVPQKSKPHHAHYNVSWCFVCSTGGMLVCCDSCPAAFHPGCVEDLDGVPDETWQCDSCREGKKPLYGDLVWVKYGFWRYSCLL